MTYSRSDQKRSGTGSTCLSLRLATLEDIHDLTDIWFAALSEPVFRQLWPDTPGVRKWWNDTNRHDMLEKPFQHYIKVVDEGDINERGKARIIAYAKWDTGSQEQRGARYIPWHADMPRDQLDTFFQREEEERSRIMGHERHYCESCRRSQRTSII